MNEEQLNQLSDEDLEHYANGDMEKMSDAGLEVLAAGPGAAPKPNGNDKGGLPNLLDVLKGFSSGALNEASLNYVPKDVFPNESPTATNLGRVIGGLVGGYGIGKAASKIPGLAKAMYSGNAAKQAATRVAANAGLSGAIGAVRNPHEGETRGGNALNDALFGTGLSVTGETLQTIPPLARFLGRTMSGLSRAEADAFRASPGSSEMLFRGMDEGGSDKISKSLQNMFRGSKEPGGYGTGLQDKLRANVINPATKQKQLYLSGDSSGVRVNTSDFEGASPEIQSFIDDVINKQTPNASPVVTRTRTPIDSSQTFLDGEVTQRGLPLNSTQTTPAQKLDIPSVRNQYDVEQMGLPFVEKSPLPVEGRYSYPRQPGKKVELGELISGGGFDEQLPFALEFPEQVSRTPIDSTSTYGILKEQEQLGLPLIQRETQVSAPAPRQRPKTIILTDAQNDRLRATAWDSARKREAAARLNPIGNDPFLPSDSRIANSARAAQEIRDPRIAPLNEQITDAINAIDKVDSMGNDLTTMLRSDGNQDLIRSYYDRNTGSSLQQMANQYEAGKKLYGNRQASLMNIPSLLAAVGGQPVSRALIRTPKLPPGVTGMSALQAILRGTEGLSD